MKYLNDLPVYGISADLEDETITCVSLVTNPAMEVPMMLFSEAKPVAVTLPEHNILTCIIRVDYPIYRRDGSEEYYVVFNQDVTRKLCHKLMTDGYQQVVSLNHDGKPITGMQLEQVFIKDTAKGINPEGFEDVAEGSLFGIYHISDDNLWQAILEGKFNGVSLESYLSIKETFNKHSKMSKLKEAIKNLLLQFNEVETDKGLLTWSEDELAVGIQVYVDNLPAPDGEYKTADNVVLVANGVVTEIKPIEVEAEPEVETIPVKAEEVEAEPAKDIVAELEAKIVELEAKIAELEAKLAEPVVEPIEAEFESQVTNSDLKLKRALEAAKAFRA